MITPPETAQTPATDYAFIHLQIPRSAMGDVFGPAVNELLGELQSQGAAPAGPVFCHHLGMDPDNFDFELAFPVATAVKAAGRVETGHRPALTVARTSFQGNYDGLPDAWGEFQQWVDAQGREQAPDIWETYVLGPETTGDPSKWQTILERPFK